jgi:hypothetical protein
MAAETAVIPQANMAPALTVEQPENPVSSKPGGPVITSMSVRLGPQIGNIATETIIPEFHFTAPGGNAVFLHREIVKSSSQNDNKNFNPTAPINIPAEAQKNGAVLTGGWGCGPTQYYTTVRAYIVASDGARSNSVQYTVHCNGG